ncbi:class I SAM-dependent methyltransferase [Haloquadratum walsbyi]|jgi:Methylase involved in ubiquinone/menaquinone biosynthesis|uniref:Methylase involved in ubiquinone/menaquinone biosynthesis n=1 Tax=Haloquadratum walsbyi J07HQW2 TaxID=1238425 RepID=U1ND68_9EURY|nr:SAM-dependent methyltransferase [Haloquadratum walsbyi]ERG94875.1 MAG: methylase involved in ubiquinone/menaquinone biosynthesis [Haloquadratum walsbyi J07HQW2]
MGHHTFDIERADALEDPGRYEYCSREELLAALDIGPTTDTDAVIADIGSGTGFYTDAVAPCADLVYAVDVQSGMHDRYRTKGHPANVSFVTAEASSLPIESNKLDAAFSTMTYHEFADPDALSELARVIRPGGRIVTVDWSKCGSGESGPPRSERYELADAVRESAAAGFTTVDATSRIETFIHIGRR